ncbi:uncharacterized protein LOC143146994 isoform X4 [Ptiloglossa arizonensis]|uniref:uncharacterized protein LOC143146994 isoform X4 n=1 Tax=Ptiloglossa arizonensis TaxID=3350558 RepID=UPI003F9EC37A
MEAAKEVDAAEEPSRTDVQLGKKEEPGRIRVLSVDKLTVEKIVLESSSGSREVLLTKNESSRKLSIKSEPGRTLPTRANEERNESTDVKYRASLPEDAFASHSSVNVSGNARSSEKISKATDTNHHQTARSVERRIKPIKLTKSPSIGGIVVTGLKSTYPGNARNKIPPKVPEKPTARNLALFARNEKEISVVDSKHDERSILARNRILDEVSSRNVTTNVNVESVEVAERKEIDEKPAVETRERIAEKQRENIEENGDDTTLEEITAKDRLEKSQSKIEVLQQNLSTKIDANTAEKYKRRLLELRASCALKLPVVVDANANVKLVGDFAFDKEFLRRHNLDQRLKIEENRVLETDLDRVSNGERGDEESNERIVTERSAKPSYSKKVSEVEKRWSGEFLENRLERRSSESSKSSYVEEFGSVSSRESVGEEHVTDAALFLEQGNRRTESEEGGGRSSIDVDGRQTSEEVLADSTDVSTVDSDSCLEDRIKAVDEDIDETTDETVDGADRRQVEFERANRWIESIVPSKDQFHDRRNEGITDRDKRQLGKPSSFYRDAGLGSTDSIDSSFATRSPSEGDGYATLIREFTMETSAMAAGSSRAKKEEKQKKKLGLRRLLPGFFSPKDSRKDYKKKESKERKRQDDRHFARYQQNGNYTRSPDTMNLNEDIKRNVKLDNSLNGSIIEERLDEIKRELFPDQGPITSTPDHLARDDDQNLLRDHRAGPPRSYTTDSSLSSIAPDERWNERNNAHLGISPDIRKFEQRQKREEFGQRYGQLERKHSLQEPNHATRSYFFHRNHGPSGRISAPPSERYLVRPRAIHPIDRPLPAIPHSRTELANYENYLEELEEIPSQTPRYGKNAYAYGLTADKSTYSNEPGLYENDNASGLILKSVSAQVKITRQPIVNQNHRAPLVGRSPKYPSSGSSQKSGDYADSSCTPNSSQKSEFSPSSSKSGEYYLHSPRDSGSPTGRDLDDDCRREGIYENEKSPSRSSTRCMDERIYDESPSSACEDRATPTNVAKQLDRSMEDSMEKRDATPNRSPAKSLQIAEKLDDPQRHEQPTNQSVGRSPASSPSGSQGKTVPSPGTRALPPLRRSQPNEQILIASPKRESPYETRIPRPSNESRRYAVESPVHITNSPRRLQTVNSLDQRGQEPSANPREDRSFTGTRMANFSGQGSSANLTAELQRPEPIYGHRGQPVPNQRSTYRVNAQKKDCEDRVAWVQGRASSPAKSPQKRGDSARGDVERNGTRTEKSGRSVDPQPTESQRPRQGHGIQSQRPVPSHASELQRSRIPCQEKSQPVANTGHVDSPRPIQQQPQQQSLQPRSLEEPVYVQRVAEPVYGQRGTIGGALSPSKQQTRQHLEAFYWQQKALEARRKSVATPASANPRQTARKIDLPEVREAVYWQQLKKLDEEQQRRIYEQNLIGDTAVAPGGSKSSGRPSGSRQGTIRSPATTDLSVSIPIGDPASWVDDRRRPKANPTGKPPLMQSQKGQNQPVLIVRPQQAIRDRREVATKPLDPARLEAQRSKSASPHFHRGDAHQTVPRKIEGRSIYEEEASDVDGKTAPPPIFKRGSLIGGESVEYGSVGGAKRVSFSNQSTVGPDLASGSWPTKHGTAPEPPTRRHRSEDSTSDTDSVFYHQDRCDAPQCTDVAEYDADRPLPPLPKDSPTNATRPAVTRNNAYGDLGWNANPDPRRATSPIADQVQQMLRQKEEEWNPDGKGRQSNDTGGSGRGEGEAGSNEIPIGRRGGGGGGGGVGSGGGGSVGGGSVLGVGGGGGSGSIGGGSVGRSGSGGGRSRDEPRRHTLGGDHQPSLHHQQFNAGQQLHPLHPHHPHHLPPPHGQYGTPPSRHTTMDLEMGTKSRQRKSPLPRGFPPPSSTMLFDDDPGIMSEVETSSTGFRRGGKQRSSLPVVRTPSKTLERPLGLVFLQYRNETKRALLPNEITSIDTVKALFVRSFPKQLTMEYLDSPHVKVYIHDSNKNMFYELEDLRSHLRDIRDRSVLRLFESSDGVPGISSLPPHWEDQSYFSEPEFDSEYQHQHIHKSKTTKNSTSVSSGYYVGGSSTLPRGGQMMRAYSPAASSVVGGPTATPTQPKPLATPGGGGVPPAKPLRSFQYGKSFLGSLGGSARFSRDSSVSLYSIADRLHGESGYMSSPERSGGGGSGPGRYPPGPYSAGSSYEDSYYAQYSGTVTPVIDEEASGWCSDTELLEESYSLYGVKPPGRPPSGPPRSPFPPGAPPPLPPGGQNYDATRIRVEHMERQLANLTGLVQKALTHAPHTSPSPRDHLQVPATRDPYARGPVSQPAVTDDSYLRTDVKPPKLGKDKSVSFEKSVSFSDEPPDMNSPKQHSPQHAADTKPTKPAIKSSTLPRMSSQERDRHKPTPPPKPAALVAGQYVYRDLALTPEMYNQLRGLQKKAKDLRQEVRNLRRMSQAQAHTVRETIRDTFITIRAMLLSGGDAAWTGGDAEKIRLSREEDLYKQEMLRLEKDLTELESTVEELRGNVINRKTRVNMSDVENMALILSKSSKTVADLKLRFPSLQEGMKGLLSSEMEKVVREEKFLKEEPERLESALRRCKKLTGTLVTLKRLASVQEQRLPNAASVDAEETPPITPTSAQHSKAAAPVPAERTVVGSASVIGGGSHPHEPPTAHQQRPENALDALLDELQTFSRPSSQLGHVPGSTTILSEMGRSGSRETTGAVPAGTVTPGRAPCISDIGRKGSVDSSSGLLTGGTAASLTTGAQNAAGTLRRLHSYPSSSDTDTSPPIARLQVSLQEQPSLPVLPQGFVPGQKPPVPERNAELLQLASARRVPPPPPPRTSSRSPLASPTSPQLPPRNHACNLQSGNTTLRRPPARTNLPAKEGKPPMALPADANNPPVPVPVPVPVPEQSSTPVVTTVLHNSSSSQSSIVLSASNSSSCESVNSQEGVQSKKGRQEQLEQRHQELLRKQKALQEQYARLQQLQRNTAGLTTVPPAPPDLLKKTGSESNLLVKMGLGLSAASSGSLTSLTAKLATSHESSVDGHQPRQDELLGEQQIETTATGKMANSTASNASTIVQQTITPSNESNGGQGSLVPNATCPGGVSSVSTVTSVANATTTTTSKIYETDIL